MLRIIAGKYKGKKLSSPDNTTIRPTKEIAKEGLFSILQSDKFAKNGKRLLSDALVLDLFCGSGALAIEAISRGAAKACLIDNEDLSIEIARKNVRAISETTNITIFRADATNLPKSRERYNLVFIDPPYGQNLIDVALKEIASKHWLAPGAIIVCECAKEDKPVIGDNYMLIEERKYGKSKFIILETL
jgi:16S rRNA (guanine966-N2)-methyltransferase